MRLPKILTFWCLPITCNNMVEATPVTLNLGLRNYVWKCQVIRVYAMKAYGWMEVQLRSLLTSENDEGEWSASHPARLIPQGKSPRCPRWIWGWVGPERTTVMDFRKICNFEWFLVRGCKRTWHQCSVFTHLSVWWVLTNRQLALGI